MALLPNTCMLLSGRGVLGLSFELRWNRGRGRPSVAGPRQTDKPLGRRGSGPEAARVAAAVRLSPAIL